MANLVTVILLYLPGVPPVYRTVSAIPDTVLMNAMACRVFLHTKLQVGHFKEPYISNSLSPNGPKNWNIPPSSAVIAHGPLPSTNRDEGAKANQSV